MEPKRQPISKKPLAPKMMVVEVILVTFFTIYHLWEQIGILRFTFMFTMLWLAYPYAVALLYWISFSPDGQRNCNTSFALPINTVHTLVYFVYFWAGPSNSKGAGHMHIIFLPILLGILTAPLLLCMLVRLVKAKNEPPPW